MIFGKNCLGIDIGASSIKIVEVSSFGKKKKLENYLEFSLPPNSSSIKTFHGDTLLLLSDKVSEILTSLFKRTKVKQRNAALSLPDFSTFFTTFSLPPMLEAEIPRAVEFEARHHIPLPLSEVTFDWQILEKKEEMAGVRLKVLLVAVPNKVLKSYQRMATLSQLKVKGMEAEVFGLVRSSIPKEISKSPICLVDIGWQSTTVSIIENRNLLVSHSFDISGTGLTNALSQGLKVSFDEAEELKKEYGLDPRREDISKILSSKIDLLVGAIKKVCQDFSGAEDRKIENVIVAGGTAMLFGLREYLEVRTKKNVQIANPFSNISYPSVLGSRLKEIGPSFAVAVGVGLMGAEA